MSYNKDLHAKLSPNIESKTIFNVNENFNEMEVYAYYNIHDL